MSRETDLGVPCSSPLLLMAFCSVLLRQSKEVMLTFQLSSWGDPYYEASSWDYSWGEIFDMKKLIEYMGGAQTFFSRLDTMFTLGANPDDTGSIIFDATNEP